MQITVASLLEAYQRADERMAALPFYNRRLEVEAVGFRAWDGRDAGECGDWRTTLLSGDEMTLRRVEFETETAPAERAGLSAAAPPGSPVRA